MFPLTSAELAVAAAAVEVAAPAGVDRRLDGGRQALAAAEQRRDLVHGDVGGRGQPRELGPRPRTAPRPRFPPG